MTTEVSTELTVTNPEATTVMANSTEQLPALQAPLPGWARKKYEAAWAEYDELILAVAEAKKHKWKTSVLQKAANGALSRIVFYDKVVQVLEAGYMLFPPVPNADVIAVRLSTRQPPVEFKEERWGSPSMSAQAKSPLAAGEGVYLDPIVHWAKFQNLQNDKGESRGVEWQALDLSDPVFPLAMAKPAIIAATNAAMEMKVFDEIRMFPFERRPKGDPCLLGSIVERKTNRRLYFLISWRIDEKDI